jgi:TRAP-type C4-dicarboxylate transport system permease small subunit
MKYLDKIINSSLFVILSVMVTTMACNVFCRFVLKFSIYWADELAQSLLVWLTFLGAAVAIRESSHYSFDTIQNSLKGAALKIYIILGNVIVIAMLIAMLYWSSTVSVGIRSWIMPAMGISRALIYVACPVGCLFMLVYSLQSLIKIVKS